MYHVTQQHAKKLVERDSPVLGVAGGDDSMAFFSSSTQIRVNAIDPREVKFIYGQIIVESGPTLRN